MYVNRNTKRKGKNINEKKINVERTMNMMPCSKRRLCILIPRRMHCDASLKSKKGIDY
jgi:hypothetical protein